MSNLFKNFLGFVCVLVGTILIAVAYTTNLTYSFVGNAIFLAGTVLMLSGGVYLIVKVMKWYIN